MVPTPRLSTEDRIRVVVLHEEGLSCNKIAERMNIARSTAQEIVKKHRETGTVKDRKGRGRKKATTKREDRAIIKGALKDRRKTSKILANELRETCDIKISDRTVRRRLLENGLKYCRAKKKPLLTEKARKKRLQWASAHRDQDWSNVIFSDESRFCLINDRPVSVRRRKGEEYLPECLNPTMKHGGGGIMVWGCISSKGVGRLYKVNGTVNGEYYINILKYCAVPSLNHHFGDGEAIFQQDNAPCHTAKVVQTWMTKNNLTILAWPGNSPDMNPIEHVWDYIADKIKAIHFKNKDELWDRIKIEWNSIPIDYLTKLYDSMKRRVEAVIKCKGGSTRY